MKTALDPGNQQPNKTCVHQKERVLHHAAAASFAVVAEFAVADDAAFVVVDVYSACTRPVLELELAMLIIAAPGLALPSDDLVTW